MMTMTMMITVRQDVRHLPDRHRADPRSLPASVWYSPVPRAERHSVRQEQPEYSARREHVRQEHPGYSVRQEHPEHSARQGHPEHSVRQEHPGYSARQEFVRQHLQDSLQCAVRVSPEEHR